MKLKLPVIFLLGTVLCLAQACSCGGQTSEPTTPPSPDGVYSISYFQSNKYVLNGPSEAQAGSEVIFSIDEIAEGYCLDYFLINNEQYDSNSFIMPSYNTFVEAVLAPADGIEYPITFSESPYGSIASSVLTAKACQEIPIFVQAKTGYRVDKIKANDVYLTIKNNGNFKYYTHTIMQNKPLYIEATFVEIEREFTNFDFALSGSNGTSHIPSAVSYWRFEYKPEGFYIEVCVKDPTVYANPAGEIWRRDNVELQMCLASEYNRPQDVKTLRCILACDGRYAFYRLKSDNTYYSLGDKVGYQYGKNFTNEAVICKQDENGFDGYVIRALFGYDLFESNYESAKGKITFCPAIRDTVSYNKDTDEFVSKWVCLTIDMTVANMEMYLFADYHTVWGNPRSFLGIAEDGEVFDRYFNLETDLLFIGDSYTKAAIYGSLYDDYADLKVSTVGFGSSQTTDWIEPKAGRYALDMVTSIAPKNVAIHLGGNDLFLHNKSLASTVTNLTTIIDTIITALPATKVYIYTMTNRLYHTSSEMVQLANDFVDEMKHVVSGRAHAILVTGNMDGFMKEDDTPNPSIFTDSTHLNAFGYAAWSYSLRFTMQLPLPSESERFGSYGKNYASNGFTYSEEENGDVFLRQRNSMSGFADRYVYFKQDVDNDYVATADFNISETYNGESNKRFGFIINDSENQIFFYIETNEYIVKKYVGVSSRIAGNYNWNYVPSIPFNNYFTDDDYTNLKIVKSGPNLKFIINGYELASLTPDFLKDSYQVGFFSSDVALNVKNPSLTMED